MKYLTFSILILCGTLWSCDRENFDDSISEMETFTPTVTELPYYTWAVGIDTVPLPIDSSWVNGSLEEDLGIIVGFSNSSSPSTPIVVEEVYNLKFAMPGGWPFAVGNYELLELEYRYSEYNTSTNVLEVVNSDLWSGSQITGVVEIAESVQRYDAYFNIDFWEHTGIVSGTLTDDDGTTHELSSAFHRLR